MAPVEHDPTTETNIQSASAYIEIRALTDASDDGQNMVVTTPSVAAIMVGERAASHCGNAGHAEFRPIMTTKRHAFQDEMERSVARGRYAIPDAR